LHKLSNIARIARHPLFPLLAAGLAARVLASLLPFTHPVDIACFKGWAGALFQHGLAGFYSGAGFHDYPPGYMYILWPLGAIRARLRLSYSGYAFTLLVKLPAMLLDLAACAVIYRAARKRLGGGGKGGAAALGVAALYCFNPAVILLSAVWGQVDAVYTFTVLISLIFLADKKYLYSFLIFALSILIKPQSLMFTPIYLFAVFMHLKEERFSARAFGRMLRYLGVCLLALFALVLPFARLSDGLAGFKPVVSQFIGAFSAYPYASFGAFNIYALFGQNFMPLGGKFLGVGYAAWGTAALAAVTVLSLLYLSRRREKPDLFFAGVLISVSVLFLSTRMHERYAFPALALLLFAFALRGGRRLIILYCLLSLAFFVNYADILNMSVHNFNYNLIKRNAVVFSVLTLAAWAYMILAAFRAWRGEDDRSTFFKV